MSPPDRGTKRTCLNCKSRFYDLKRVPPVCPQCKTALSLDRPARKSKPSKPETEIAVPAAKVDNVPDDAIDDEVDDFEEVEDVTGEDDDVDFNVNAADNPMIEGTDDLDDEDVPVFSPGRNDDDDDA